MKTTVTKTTLKGLVLVEIEAVSDTRGFFIEPWHKRDFQKAGLEIEFVQEGHSLSKKHVLRGLHYQNRKAPMGKLVRCTRGRVFEVAADIRTDSPTFGRWFTTTLSSEGHKQIFVPPGFALGFVVLTSIAEVLYKQTHYYTPSAEGTIAWNDPDLAIPWPVKNPILSQRDQDGMSLTQYMRLPRTLRW